MEELQLHLSILHSAQEPTEAMVAIELWRTTYKLGKTMVNYIRVGGNYGVLPHTM
jgi:hypothetical protein